MSQEQMDANQTNDGVPSTTTAPAGAPAAPAAPASAQGGQTQGEVAPAAPAPIAAPSPAPAALTPPVEGAQSQPPVVETKEPQPAKAPEAYTFELPEEVTLSADALAAYSDAAKSLNLPQDQAQSILAKVAPHMLAHQAQAAEVLKAQWNESSVNDKEFGGDNLEANLGVAKRAVDAFGSPELNTLLADSGLASHPEIIRLLYRAGKAISPDGFIPSGGSAPAGRRDPAKVLFG